MNTPLRGNRIAAVAVAVLLPLVHACAAPAPEEERTKGLAELREMMSGGQPVKGTQVDGSVPLEADPFALAEPGAVLQPGLQQDGEAPAPEVALLQREDPYIHFGERIIVRQGVGGVAFITKTYTMPAGKAKKIVELLGALQPFTVRARPGAEAASGEEPPLEEPPLDPGVLEYQVLEGWDTESYSRLKPPEEYAPPVAATQVVLSDLIVVTASYEMLEQFEEFLDLFAAAGIPQIELEAKIIEVVEIDQFDYGSNATFDFGDSNFVQSFGFNLPNLASGAEALLDLGAVQSSLAFDAVLEAIRTWDNVQIESRPKTVVRAGGVASVESTTEIPYFEIKTLNTDGDFTTNTVYKKIGVQLYISPRLIGTKTLALDVHLIGSQQVGSQSTFSIDVDGGGSGNNTVIEVPVIAYRTVSTIVYLEPGQTLVIGGLTTQRDRELENRVPILGDIPLLGLLFRSKFTRKEKQHVLFAISPRILQHSDFEEEF